MEQYSPDDFARHRTRVRSPNSRRRTRRLLRFALMSATLALGGVALLVLALTA